MARADFNYIPVNRTLTEDFTLFQADFPVEFSFGQAVVDDGYLLITCHSKETD